MIIKTLGADTICKLASLTVVGFTLGRKAGTAAVLLYLFEGVVGLPVFGGGSSGIAPLLGPSGGYLIGFVPTAYVLGSVIKTYFAHSGKVLPSLYSQQLLPLPSA